MPARQLLLDLRCRNESICRVCLSSIRQQPSLTTSTWTATYSSQARGRLRPRARQASRASVAPRSREYEMAQQMQKLQEANPSQQTGTGDISVRFFDQQDEKRVQLRDEQAWDESFNAMDAPSIKTGFLQTLKNQIGSAEGRSTFQEVVDQLDIDWDNIKTDEDIERARRKMTAYTASIDREIEKTSKDLPKEMVEELQAHMEELTSQDALRISSVNAPQIPEDPWTPNQRRKIARLNAVLARVWRQSQPSLELTDKTILTVFKAYHAARFSLAHGWSNVPLDVWDTLWKIFSAEESINAHRLSHISMLARDMSEAKVTLNPAQQLLTIEAVFVDGWESKALENWRRSISTLGDEKAESFRDFWELGVRMYSRMGDMEQANRAVGKLLARNQNPRILMTIIRTYSEQGTEEAKEKAWASYRQMRELLGQNMKLSDYDQVISFFLTTNQTENALHAFVDMMSDGQIDLKKQKHMPSVIANKFFLGKWLKRLIGAGDLNGAFEVVSFMRTKGVEAAPIHLNGLIGAWQRSGGTEDLARADTLGWEMIESRIAFVQARKATANSVANSTAPTPPRANLETFSLLAENYRLRGLHDRQEKLWNAFHEAEISPDAFMMNQLLESYIQAGQSKQALELYESFVNNRGVVPDPHTFSALWKTLGINRLHVVSDESLGQQALETRALFAETVKFRGVFEGGRMDGQLARKILHTFRRLKDNAGFLMALAALKEAFGFIPPETLVLEMVLGSTKLKWDTPSQRKGLMFAKRDIDRELQLWARGDAQRLEGEARGEALYEYLQKKFWPEGVAQEDVDRVLGDAARQMGVYDLLHLEELD
ncbi:Pentatricopeptide repeat-containing protein [Paramyrothecium foliicola]|nr:Pentatricopeptide repeat-containing protein [Paramyrothecium foliicola]